MKRAHPLFSPFGMGFTLLMLIGFGAMYWRQGGLLFNPGEVSALSRPGVALQGFVSHAEFEAECQRCHKPLQTIQGELCLDCHTSTGAEINAESGPHSQFEAVKQCFACHSDHQGRDFNPTAGALQHFDHNLADFSLKWHLVDYSANPIDCQDCHTMTGGFETPMDNCSACHRDYDLDFMTAHELNFGVACLDCHDGQDRMVDFNHEQTTFRLIGQHSSLACAECHQNAQFAGTPVECIACHVEPEIHTGLFSNDCVDCHSPEGWSEALWQGQPFDHLQSGFSLERHLVNYANQPLSCQACHVAVSDQAIGFTLQECTACHQLAEPLFMAEHQQQFGGECLSCHDGTGRLANFDHQQFFVLDGEHANIACEDCHVDQVYRGTATECANCHTEPQIHAGLFGLQCQNCHSSQAWVPASLTSHGFPLDHGDQGLVECETCHPNSYVEYTCYGCHDHQAADIQNEHLEEGVSLVELVDCAGCHPNGLEDEAEND